MTEEPTTEGVEAAVETVTHPEIDATLSDLGMIDGVEHEGTEATVTLVLPMRNIPDQVKNILVGRLQEAVAETGVSATVEITVMSDAQRERFFELETENWEGGIDESQEPVGGTDSSEPPF
ncbi:iron-sulfur cluster assembly protein [Halodesulfurarchaeum sp.]|uniref:iron-sulfur cluster assembly protein n=1 Tax=Halodesulfurarchaeum sp. TaxID=1980530 RepID=UPI002FC34F58